MWLPAESLRVFLKGAPAWKLVPPAASANVPAPDTDTAMLEGAQPALSRYTTENEKDVAVEPLPGLAVPELRTMSCFGPPHATAATGCA